MFSVKSNYIGRTVCTFVYIVFLFQPANSAVL